MRSTLVYRCEKCGNLVELLYQGGGALVCCGAPMKLLEEKSDGEGKEEHSPWISEEDGSTVVEVGVVPHEMSGDHRIIWIEIESGRERIRKYLNPGDHPLVYFPKVEGGFTIRLLCNRHGLWSFRHEPAPSDLESAVKDAVNQYNSLRNPESVVNILELTPTELVVEFTGNFCRTCGFYDYFEDLRLMLRDRGVKAEVEGISEFEDGAVVRYRLGRWHEV